MQKLSEILRGLQEGAYHEELSRVYGADEPMAVGRLTALLRGFCDYYGADGDTPVCLLSTPGRTEIGSSRKPMS